MLITACLPTCMSRNHACASANRGQKRILDPLELELQTVVDHLVGAENLCPL